MKSIFLNIIAILVPVGILGLSFMMLFICVNSVNAYAYKLKNPFISPFKQKSISTYRHKTKTVYKLNLQAIIASSEKNLNIAIINDKPYYINSKILSVGKIIDITKGVVIIESKKGKIIRLFLKKFEGFQN
jgi:hypothetical protein